MLRCLFVTLQICKVTVSLLNCFGSVRMKYHQINYAPTDMYDAMILYYEVNPIEIWEI